MKTSFFKFSMDNANYSKDIATEIQEWKEAINTLIETVTDPDFEKKYPGFTKKDIIDLAFNNGALNNMSLISREQLHNKFLNA